MASCSMWHKDGWGQKSLCLRETGLMSKHAIHKEKETCASVFAYCFDKAVQQSPAEILTDKGGNPMVDTREEFFSFNYKNIIKALVKKCIFRILKSSKKVCSLSEYLVQVKKEKYFCFHY